MADETVNAVDPADDQDLEVWGLIDEARELPPAAPTLARHLLQVLQILDGCHLDRSDRAVCGAAAGALEDLPRVDGGTEVVGGAVYWRDDRGALIPEAVVKAQDKLRDEAVRKIVAGAIGVSDILRRFKTHSMGELYAFLALIAQEYGAESAATTGSVTLYTYDREFRVVLARADKVAFGPEIHAARTLLLEYLAAEPGPEPLKALVSRALGLDRQASVRPAEVLRLRVMEIGHPKWNSAMRAIDDAMRSAGTAEYLRVYRRDAEGRWVKIPLDLAGA